MEDTYQHWSMACTVHHNYCTGECQAPGILIANTDAHRVIVHSFCFAADRGLITIESDIKIKTKMLQY